MQRMKGMNQSIASRVQLLLQLWQDIAFLHSDPINHETLLFQAGFEAHAGDAVAALAVPVRTDHQYFPGSVRYDGMHNPSAASKIKIGF
jgi:hypothetical protein